MRDSMQSLRHLAARKGVAVLIALAAAAMALPAFGQQLYEEFVLAATNDRADQVKSMLARGMDPNTVAPNGDPVLFLAARAGNVATVDALLAAKGVNVNLRNKFGDTALMAAALTGQLEIVKKLKARGGEVNGTGWTPLIYAATGGHDEVVRYLLAEGADINAVSPNGTSALMMAVRENKVGTAELLIAKGANVNVRNENGASALDWAKRTDDTAMVARLKRAGARD
jgi:ankyrin repeat protein